ncbi:MAG TPA: hypothetical protein VF810_04795 [Patescibacteria group bacterium]
MATAELYRNGNNPPRVFKPIEFIKHVPLGVTTPLRSVFAHTAAREVTKLIHKGRDVPPAIEQEFNTLTHYLIDDIFRLPPGSDPNELFQSSMRGANETIDYVISSVVPFQENILGLINDISVFGDKPYDTFADWVSQNTDPRLRFETRRQFGLAYTAAAIEARSRTSGLRGVLKKVQTLFNSELYEGLTGSGKEVSTFAWHDNNTNSIRDNSELSFEPIKQPYSNSQLKRHTYRARIIPDIGLVHSDFNEKSLASAVIKAVRKSNRETNGLVDIDESLMDIARGKMIVLGTSDPHDPSIATLIDKVKNILQTNSESGKLPPIEITDNDQYRPVDGIDVLNFKRIMIHFEGIPVPIELIFSDEKQALNDIYEIGNRGDDGHYNGRAHSLYESQRLQDLLAILFPQRYYFPDMPKNYLQQAALENEYEIAKKLLNALRVN